MTPVAPNQPPTATPVELGLATTCSETLEFRISALDSGLLSHPAARCGGTKGSGLGREGGDSVLLQFLEAKYVGVAVIEDVMGAAIDREDEEGRYDRARQAGRSHAGVGRGVSAHPARGSQSGASPDRNTGVHRFVATLAATHRLEPVRVHIKRLLDMGMERAGIAHALAASSAAARALTAIVDGLGLLADCAAENAGAPESESEAASESAS